MSKIQGILIMNKNIKHLTIIGKILYFTGAIKKIDIYPYPNVIVRKYHPLSIIIKIIDKILTYIIEEIY